MRFLIKYLYQVTLDQKLGSEFKPRKAPSETKKYTTIRICTNFSPNRGSVQTKQPLVQPRKIAKSYDRPSVLSHYKMAKLVALGHENKPSKRARARRRKPASQRQRGLVVPSICAFLVLHYGGHIAAAGLKDRRG